MTAQNSPLKNEQLTVSKAADFLHISASSLRKLEREGRIKSERAVNGYRNFDINDLINLRNYIENKKISKEKTRTPSKPYFPAVTVNKTLDNTVENDSEPVKRPHKFAHSFVLALLLLTLITSTAAAYKKIGSDVQIASTTSLKDKGAVLADSTKARDWRVNFNTPAFFKKLATFEQNVQMNTNLNVDGIITSPTLTFTGTGTINQLDAIDDVTETTLENALDLTGDITSTGLNNTTISENVIGDIELDDAITYSGELDIAGSITFDGQSGDDGDILSSDGSGLPIWIPQTDIDAGSVEGLTSADFLRSNTSDDFTSGALTFSDSTLLDLSLITHSGTTSQGLILPQSTNLVNPSVGEGYLAYDTDDNALKIYNGTTWADVVDSTVLNESTIFDGDVTGTYNTLNIEPDTVGTAEIDDGSITPADLDLLNAPLDDYILAYDGGSFKWVLDTGAAGSSKWTDSGTISFLTDTDDDLAVGGTDATARFFFDYSDASLKLGTDGVEGKLLLYSNEATDYTATLTTGTLGGNNTFTFDGASGIVLTDTNATTQLSGWDQDSSNDLTTSTIFAGDISGTYGAIAIDEDTIEGMIFDADAETITGIWEVQDEVAFNFGNDANWSIMYDETTDDRLEFTSSGSNNAVLFDLLDTDSASTFTITNSDGSNVANLSIEGGIDTGNGVYEIQDATTSIKGLASFSDTYFTVVSGAVAINDIYLLDDGDVGTGVYDFGDTTSFEITNSAAPTVNAAGEIAIDTTITDHTGLITYYDGTEALYAIAVPTANLTPSNDQILAYNETNDEFYFKDDIAGIVYSANNGLSLDATVFKLGGDLIEETAIATLGFDIEIDNIRLDSNTISTVNTDGNLTLSANGSGDLYFNGATYNLSDTGDLTIGGSVTFENAEYIQNESNGSLVFTGVGGSNNGVIAFDLESNSIPTLTTSTATAIGIDEDLTFIDTQTISTTTGALNITANSGNLALSAITSGDITATPSGANALFNILTGNLKVGDGTPTVTLDGEDAYIEGTFEVDGTSNLAGTLTFAGVATDITTGTNETLTLSPNGAGDVALSADNDSNVLINGTLTSNSTSDFLSSTLTNQTSSGTQRIVYLENANDAANATTEALLALNNTESTANLVTDYLIINASTEDTTADAIDVSDPELFNALNIGQNYLLSDGIRQFSPSSGTWTLENTSGTDFISVTGSALTVGSNGSEGTIVLYSEEGGTDYTATLLTGTLANSNHSYTFSGADGTVVTTGNATTELSTWDQDSSDDLTTSTNFGGHVNGTYNNISINEATIEGMIFDDDAETILGIWEVQDGVAFNFGNDANWSVAYDETTDDRLEFTSAGTNNAVLFDLLDTDSASTFTISNSDGTYLADLSVEGSITSGNMLTVNTPAATSGTATLISNAGSGASFRVDDVASDTSPFIIDASGNVGIGTEAPNAKLEILPSSAAALQIHQYSTSAGATGELRFMEGGATSTQYTGFKAPDSLTSSLVYILPNHNESGSEPSSNEVLTWTTGNQLKWQSISGVGAGDISEVGDATGSTAFTSGTENDGNSLFFSGTTTNDTNETQLTVTDPTDGDVTVTLPNITGVLASLAGTQTFSGDKTFTGSLSLTPTSTNDISITTDTDSLLNISGLADGSGDALCIDGSNNVVTCTSGVGEGGISGSGNANQIAFFDGTSSIDSDSDFTFNGVDLDYTAAYNTGFDIAASLSGGARTAAALSIVQASNVSNNFNSSTTGLLRIENQDTGASGSTAPLVYLTGAVQGSAIENVATTPSGGSAETAYGLSNTITANGEAAGPFIDTGIGVNNVLAGAYTDLRGINTVIDVANGTSYGSYVNTDTDTLGTGYGYYYTSDAGSTAGTQYAFYGDLSAGTATKNGIYVTGETYNYLSGSLGIGDGATSPEALLEIQGTEGADATIALDADQGDDTTDTWFIKALAGSSNALSILNDSTEVFALTTGGNLQIDGDLTITGDGLFMTTNTTGFMLIADGTNFNPVDVTGDIDIVSTGVTTIQDESIDYADFDIVDGSPLTDEYCLSYESGGANGSLDWKACSGTTYTFSDGLIEDSGQVKLGGMDIDESRTITVATGGDFNIDLTSATATQNFVIKDGGTAFATFDNTGFFQLDNLVLNGNVISSTVGDVAITPISAADLDINLTGTGGDFLVDTADGAISLDAIGVASNFTLTSDGAGEDLTISVAGATDSSLVLSSSGTAADALQITAIAGGIDISASGAADGEDIDITATGSSVFITSTQAVNDALKFTASSAGGGILFDAGTTDKTADALVFDVDINSANVDGLFIDLDIGTALSAAEIANGINIDVAGLGTDDAASFVNGLTITGNALTGTGTMTGIDIEGTFDADINLQNDETISNANDGTIALSGDLSVVGGDITGANSAAIDLGENVNGDISFYPNNDADDYLYMNTADNIPGLFWEGIAAQDPAIYVTGEELGYRDENDLWVSFDSIVSAGAPGGSNTQVQYNNGGSFGGMASLTYNNVDGSITATSDLSLTLAGAENLAITSDLAGSVNVISLIGTPSVTSGTAYGFYLSQVDSANANGFDAAFVIENLDTDLAIADGVLITSAAGLISDAIDASDSDIVNALNVGTNTITGTGYTINSTSGDLSLTTTTSGDINLTPGGTDDIILSTDNDSNIQLGGTVSGSNSIDLLSIALTNGATSGNQNAVVIVNNDYTNGITESLLTLSNLETTANLVSNYLLIESTAADTVTDAIDVSDADIFNAINVGQNYILGNGIRQYSSSSTTWKFQDITSGNDLFSITNNATVGDISISGDLSVLGGNIAGANSAAINIGETVSGDISFYPNNDTDDYLYMNTASHIPGLFWEGIAAQDPAIYVTGEKLGYRDENDAWVSFDSLLSAGAPGGVDTQVQYNNGGSFGGMSSLTFNDATLEITATDDVTFNQDHLENFEITSSLVGGGRTTSAFSITQANDATYNFDTNFSSYAALLHINNEDLDSSAPLIYLGQASTVNDVLNTGMYVNAPNGGYNTAGVTVSVADSGQGILVTNLYNSDAAYGISVRAHSDNVGGAMVSFAGDYVNVGGDSSVGVRTYGGVSTITESGNYLDVYRNMNTGSTGGWDVTGDLATLSTQYSESGAGNITDTSNILALAQNCGTNVSCTGAVLDIVNAGTGQGMLLTSSATGTLLDLNTSGANTAADGILIQADNASGVITDAIDVSDGEIVNALNIGQNTILSSGSFTIDLLNAAAHDTLTITNSDGTYSANLAVEGDLTVSGDDITMGTNTTGMLLIADGSNFSPTAVSGDISIANTGITTIQDQAIDASDFDIIDGNSASNGYCLTYDTGAGGSLEWVDCSGTSAGGSDTQVQYNNGGSFGGMSSLTFDDATLEITATDDVTFTYDNAENFEITSALTGGARTADIFSLSIANDVTNNFTTGNLANLSLLDTGSSADVLEINNYGTGNSLTINDVSADTSPFIIDADGDVGIGTTSATERLAVAGGNILQTASTPTLEGSYNTVGSAFDVYVVGRYAYVADVTNGLVILDVSVPATPTLVGGYDTTGNAREVQVVGKYAYVADGTSGLHIINISNPNAPVLVGTYDSDGQAYGVVVSGSYAYLADDNGGMDVVNISNPASPTLAGTYAPADQDFQRVFIKDKYVYAANYNACAGDFRIIDISNPASPSLAGTYTYTNPCVIDVQVSGSYAYILDESDGLYVVDISDPTTPTLAGSLGSLSGAGIDVYGNYAYISRYNSGLAVVDISNPTAPSLVGTYDTPDQALHSFAAGKYLYVADRTTGVVVLDITGTTLPSLSAGVIEGGTLSSTENTIVGNDLYVGNSLSAGMGGFFGGSVAITSPELKGDVKLLNVTGIPSATAGTAYGFHLSQANSANTNGFDAGFVIDNLDTDLAMADGILINSAAGAITDAIDATDTDIVNALNFGTNVILGSTGSIDMLYFDVDGTNGNITTAGTLAVNGNSITASGATLTINAGGAVDVQDNLSVNSLTTDTGGITILAGQSIIPSASGALTIGDANLTALNVTTTATGNTAVVLPNDSIGANEILTTGQNDEYCLTYETGGTLEWANCASPWTDAGTYLHPATSTDVLGNSASAGANKIAGIYLGDSSPLYFGADNDVNFSFSGSTLSATLGNNDINFDSNTLFIDGSANSVGIGTATPSGLLNVLGTSGELLRLSYDTSNYTSFSVASTGILTLAESGTTIGTFGEAQVTFDVPVAFNAAGDASYGYDLVLTNQTASKLESYGPLTIEVGESFENNNLTLTTYGTGQLMVGAAGGSTFTVSGNTVASFDRLTSDGTIISLKQDTTEEGTISISGNTVSYNAFTGSHYAWTNESIERGELVSLTEDNKKLHNNESSEILYGVKQTTIENDPKVLGAYLALQEPTLPASIHNPHLIMAVGNGEMWIVDAGENIEAGDYIISSSTKGHARKDSDIFAKSYVIARAAESIDWGQVTDTIEGKKHAKISITFENFIVSRFANGLANINDNTNIPSANVITTDDLHGAVAGVDTQIDQVNTEIQTINERLSVLETLTTESTQSTENSGTIDTALLQEMTDLFNEFKSFIANLGLSSSTNGEGDLVLTVENALAVLGDTTLNNLDVTGKLNAGFVQIDPLEQSIGVLGPKCYNAETETYHEELCESQTLFIQKELAGNVDIFNANIVLTPEGDIVSKGTVEAKQVKTDELTIKGQTIGSGTMLANTTIVTISSELIKANSKVFITPTTSTLGQTVYLKEKTAGEEFKVAIDFPVAQDIKFDWFIVNEE